MVPGCRWYDLILILDDVTSEIYYAQLVEDECTRRVMAALRDVIEARGWFASIYRDRVGHSNAGKRMSHKET